MPVAFAVFLPFGIWAETSADAGKPTVTEEEGTEKVTAVVPSGASADVKSEAETPAAEDSGAAARPVQEPKPRKRSRPSLLRRFAPFKRRAGRAAASGAARQAKDAVPLFDEEELQRTGLRIAWQKTGPADARLVRVVLAGDFVLMETAARRTIALDAGSGKHAWTFDAEGALNCAPVVTDDGVFLVAGEVLYSITKAELGVYDWRRPLRFAATTEPVPYGKFLVFGSTGARIMFFNRKLRDVQYKAYCRGNVLPEPAVHGGKMAFATTEGLLYQIVLDDRKIDWRYGEVLRTVSSSPALDERSERPCLVFGTEEQYLIVVDHGTGRPPKVGEHGQWEVLLSGPITQRPRLQGKDLILAIADGSGLHAVNREKAEEVWFAAGITQVLASGGAEIYCVTQGRQLAAVDAKTGKIGWRRDLSPFEFTPEALSRELIVLATGTGDIYALVPPAAPTPREDVEDLKPAAEPEEEKAEETEEAPAEEVDEEVAPDEEL